MIARRKPIARSAPPSRSTRPKAVNAKRKRTNFARAYGSKERVEWIQAQPCAVCGWAGGCENAHVPTRSGAGRKGDARFIVPLCGARPARPGEAVIGHGGMDAGCHAHLHKLGKRLFEKCYYVDLDALAEATERAWRQVSAA